MKPFNFGQFQANPDVSQNVFNTREIQKSPEDEPVFLLEVQRKVKEILEAMPSRMYREIREGGSRLRCGEFSYQLGWMLSSGVHRPEAGIEISGIPSILLAHAKQENRHAYLLLRGSHPEHDIVIEPTVGQYVEGYYDVFVGRREELKALVMGSVIINTSIRDQPKKEVFERIWGSDSIAMEVDWSIHGPIFPAVRF